MGDPDDQGTDHPDPTRCKVGRLIAERGLDGYGEELEALWTGETGERHSLRDLADAFNRRLLAAALEGAEIQTLDGEVENLYRLLTAADVSAGARMDAVSRLERGGVDVDRLEGEFVSHQAIHTYLTDYRGVDHPSTREEGDRRESATQSIRRLANRLTAVAETNLAGLDEGGHLDVGHVDVVVDVQVLCRDCGGQYEFGDLLERGGCECD